VRGLLEKVINKMQLIFEEVIDYNYIQNKLKVICVLAQAT